MIVRFDYVLSFFKIFIIVIRYFSANNTNTNIQFFSQKNIFFEKSLFSKKKKIHFRE